MKRSSIIVLALLLVSTSVLPAASHVFPFAAAEAPPPPSAPVVSPAQAPNSEDWTPPLPDLENLPPEVEEARARQAMEEVLDKYLQHFAPEAQTAPLEVTVEDEWALGVAQWQGEEKAFGDAVHVVAHRLPQGYWQALMPSEEGLYLPWLDALPQTLVSESRKRTLRNLALTYGPKPTKGNILDADTLEPLERPGVNVVEELPEPGKQLTPIPTPTLGPPVDWEPGKEQLLMAQAILYDENNVLIAHSVDGSERRVIGRKVKPADADTLSGNKVLQIDDHLPHAVRASHGYELYGGVYSSGNDQVAYLEQNPSTRAFNVWLADLGGADRKMLLSEASSPSDLPLLPVAWSDAYHTLILNAFVPDSDLTFEGLWALDLTSGVLGELELGQSGYSSNPLLSPDGELLVFNASTYAHAPLYSNDVVKVLDLRDRTIWTLFRSEALDAIWLYGWAPKDTRDLKLTPHEGYREVNPTQLGPYLHGAAPLAPDQPGLRLPWPRGESHCVTNASHPGYIAIDFDYPNGVTGDAVLAAAAGEVVLRENDIPTGTYIDNNYGNFVKLRHSGGYYTLYAHLDYHSITVNVGDQVGQGCKIAEANNTGMSSGDHLHFELRNPSNQTIWPVFEDCSCTPTTGGCSVSQQVDCGSGTCSAPSLNSPSDNYTETNPSRNVSFTWSAPSDCTPDGYTFRVSTSSNMDIVSGLPDRGEGGTSTSHTFGSEWDNQDLYWSVRACKPCTPYTPGPWASSRRFRIDPQEDPPCNPNENQIALYADTDYRGACVTLGVGQYPNPGHLGSLGNDNAESIKVGAQVEASLWEHENYSGRTSSYSADDSSLWNEEIGGNAVSSVRVEVVQHEPDPPSRVSPPDGATFEEGEDVEICWTDTGDRYYGTVWSGNCSVNGVFGYDPPHYATCKTLSHTYLPGGCEINWLMEAELDGRRSAPSEIWYFVVKPKAPTNLSAQATSCSEVDLSWTDNSDNETGYQIYRDGSPIRQAGANATSYHDGSLAEDTNYSYYVKAYRGSIYSDASNTANAHTPDCPPADTEPPEVTWLYPVLDGEVYTCRDEVIQLEAIATDNVAVERVHFYRWDHPDQQNYDIDTDYSSPDQASLDCSILNIGWNQVNAKAYDTSGNASDWRHIWVNRPEPQPDLRPHTLSGYPYPVVPSSVAGTHEVNTLYAGVPTYFDWHWINSGNATAAGAFYVELWVGSDRHVRYPYADYQAGWSGGFDDWSTPIQEPGWHTVQLVTDPDGTISEYDEGNNSWEMDFYWENLCGDEHELNNEPSRATSITYGQTKSAYICDAGDLDYYQFTGQSGDKVVIDIDARVHGSDLDSYVFLLKSDGETVLAQNDDAEGSLDSKFGVQLPHDGTYFVKVREYSHPNGGGSSYGYDLRVHLDNGDPTGDITSPVDDAWIDPNWQTIEATAADAEGGVYRVEFLWHSADWANDDWEWLGSDTYGSNGWSLDFDTSDKPEQRGAAFYIWPFDWVGNYGHGSSWNLGIDRTPPTVSAEVDQMYDDAPFRDFWVNWWNGFDNLSGIATYDVQVRDGAGGTWQDLATGTTSTYHQFVGEDGHTYYFRARARDYAATWVPMLAEMVTPSTRSISATLPPTATKLTTVWQAQNGSPPTVWNRFTTSISMATRTGSSSRPKPASTMCWRRPIWAGMRIPYSISTTRTAAR